MAHHVQKRENSINTMKNRQWTVETYLVYLYDVNRFWMTAGLCWTNNSFKPSLKLLGFAKDKYHILTLSPTFSVSLCMGFSLIHFQYIPLTTGWHRCTTLDCFAVLFTITSKQQNSHIHNEIFHSLETNCMHFLQLKLSSFNRLVQSCKLIEYLLLVLHLTKD